MMAKNKKRSLDFIIHYPDTKAARKCWNKFYSLNSIYAGKPWKERKKDSDFWHWYVFAALRKQSVPLSLFENPVRITIFWNDALDVDNHAYMGKMIVDALKGKLIAGDSRKYFRSITHDFHDEDLIRVHIQEV